MKEELLVISLGISQHKLCKFIKTLKNIMKQDNLKIKDRELVNLHIVKIW